MESEKDRELQRYVADRQLEIEKEKIKMEKDIAKGKGRFELLDMGKDILFPETENNILDWL